MVFKDEISIVLCGEAGLGINTVETLLVKILKLSGYNVFSSKEYMSRIRGGTNSTWLRVSSTRVKAPVERMDIFVPLDKDSIPHLAKYLSKETIIIGDRAKLETERPVIDVPFFELSTRLGNPVFSNVIAVGVLANICGVDFSVLEGFLKKHFASKGDEIVSKNIQAAKTGFGKGAEIISSGQIKVEIKRNKEPLSDMIMNGAEVLGLGAIAGGCNFLSSYPMSPSTGVLIFMAENASKFGVVVEQAEDEISAMNMTIGSWYAGARGMVTTSGGGFDLMAEGISLAGITETPVVVHIGQRPGPATGLPTRTEQADLEIALYSGHGEFPRIILAPGNLDDAFYLSQRAFNLADKYQVPVFLLTDQFLLESYYNNPQFDTDGIGNEYFVSETGPEYKRYQLTENGISPRGIPGNGKGFVMVDSDEHDEDGRITEDLDLRVKMEDKRRKKMEGIVKDIVPPVFNGTADSDTIVVSWGSTYEVIEEALALMNRSNIAHLHFKQVYPLYPDTKTYLSKAKKVIIIENNATAQFAKLIKLYSDYDIIHKILKYNGLPFSVEEIKMELEKVI
jgi:2-oxoglutarate ferredoxin oxidoreductase subunit alpha